MENEFNQSKLIIKTLVVLVILTLFVSAVFMTFFPKQAGAVCEDLGMNDTAMSFYKTSYNKTDDINTLAAILSYEIGNENHEEIIEYGIAMVTSANYEDYVAFVAQNVGSYVGYDIYVETNLVKSLYICGENDEVKSILASRVISDYETLGIGISLANEIVANGDVEMAEDILSIFNSAYNNATDMQKYNMIIESSILLEVVPETVDIWIERLEELEEKFAEYE